MKHSDQNIKKLYFLIFISICIYFIAEIIITSTLLYFSLLSQSKNNLQSIANHITNNIQYVNGKFSLLNLNSDPLISNYYPLYIFSKDGLVIYRGYIIQGYLDKSSISRLGVYNSPETIYTTSNEYWRIYSKNLFYNGTSAGLVLVSEFEPNSTRYSQIDTTLKNNANLIAGRIQVNQDKLQIPNNIRKDVNYNVNYEIIDQYNNIVTRSSNVVEQNRLPDFIDRSYVGDVVYAPDYLQIFDPQSRTNFIMAHELIKDNRNNIVGVMAVGIPITYIDQAVKNDIVIQCLCAVLLIIILFGVISVILKQNVVQILRKTNSNYYDLTQIKKISFNKELHRLFIK